MINKYYIYKIQYRKLCYDLNNLCHEMQKVHMSKSQISTLLITLVRDSFNLTCDLLKEEEVE